VEVIAKIQEKSVRVIRKIIINSNGIRTA